jgi:ribosome-binding factor A
VAAELRLKHTPMLEFDYDDSVDRAMRLSRLMEAEASRLQGEDR